MAIDIAEYAVMSASEAMRLEYSEFLTWHAEAAARLRRKNEALKRAQKKGGR